MKTKKLNKKLVLNKQSVAILRAPQLHEIQGGVSFSCVPEDCRTITCRITCIIACSAAPSLCGIYTECCM